MAWWGGRANTLLTWRRLRKIIPYQWATPWHRVNESHCWLCRSHTSHIGNTLSLKDEGFFFCESIIPFLHRLVIFLWIHMVVGDTMKRTKKRLFLIRHFETEGNRQGIVLGQSDSASHSETRLKEEATCCQRSKTCTCFLVFLTFSTNFLLCAQPLTD